MQTRPTEQEFAPYYAGYIALVPESDILTVLRDQLNDVVRLASAVPLARETHRYAPGKWSVREVFGHIADVERLFAFRAFCFSRGETSPLPSFDENAYEARSRHDERPLADLVAEFVELRTAHLRSLVWLDDEAWGRTGTASGARVSVRALTFLMAGHVRHHLRILEERYAVAAPRA